jgi:hypothetical protein
MENEVTYKVAKKQPSPRDPSLTWEDRSPGLYDDGEVLVQLDDIHATVSVEHKWLDNGAGVTFFGTARWCDADGQTHLCPQDQHVETFVSLTVDPVTLSKHDFAALKKEVLLALMGEEPELKIDDGEGNQVPVIAFSETVKLNGSIRHAAKTVSAMKASSNPKELLA